MGLWLSITVKPMLLFSVLTPLSAFSDSASPPPQSPPSTHTTYVYWKKRHQYSLGHDGCYFVAYKRRGIKDDDFKDVLAVSGQVVDCVRAPIYHAVLLII